MTHAAEDEIYGYVAQLKKRSKELAAEVGPDSQNWQIRVHRALSWLKRAIDTCDALPEVPFLFHWIAFNSLYASWDKAANAPEPDAQCRRLFLTRIWAWDPQRVTDVLKERRRMLIALAANPYLAEGLWRAPTCGRVSGIRANGLQQMRQLLAEQQYERVLEEAFARIGVLRGQLVHGASTSGGRLNRSSIACGLQFLGQFVPLFACIVIEHGSRQPWPDLCYPPVAPAGVA